MHKFLGLVSHYYSYIHEFADIAKLLHNLTQKQLVQFNWSDLCETKFIMFKKKLVQASVLAYPPFGKSPLFVLQIDASSIKGTCYWICKQVIE